MGKTRDASDRLLPPVLDACTRTSRVSGSCRGLHRVGASRTLGTVRLDRRTGWFTPPATASADRQGPRSLRSLRTSVIAGLERGYFLPAEPFTTEPLTSLSPLPLSDRRLRLRALAADREGAAETAVTTTP